MKTSDFIQIYDTYINRHLKPSSVRLYRLCLSSYIVPWFGECDLDKVRRAQVVELHSQLHARPYMANRTIAIGRSMYSYAGIIEVFEETFNPFRKIKLYREKIRDRHLNRLEYRAVERLQDEKTFLALFGALSFALLSIQIRKMAGTERTDMMVFYAGLTFFCLMGIIVIWKWTEPTGQDWLILCGVGVISLIAQLCIVHSFQFAPAYFIAPFEFITLLWALILGWLVFAEIPTSLMLLGVGLIVVSGLAVVRIETRNITNVKLHTDR